MHKQEIQLQAYQQSINATIQLPGSKSECNRALIIRALCKGDIVLDNIASARDTATLMRLLESEDETLDVLDAGTTMRFLTAYIALTGQQKKICGTARMHERPIGILVDALRTIGAKIDYLEQEGYPPIAMRGFKAQQSKAVSIDASVSSQYITALMLLAPSLPEGLIIKLRGKVGSRPYINMTLKLMAHFGAEVAFEYQEIRITSQPYQPNQFSIEGDWSGASYWFSMVALASEGSKLSIKGLKKTSLQGDIEIVDIMKKLGVASKYEHDTWLLSKTNPAKHVSIDFSNCPDLAQTVAVCCAAKGISGTFTGLESLKIKETDRVLALQEQLAKIGADLIEKGEQWELVPSQQLPTDTIFFKTYHDHRMAMAFAPLCMKMSVAFDDRTVVNKSYPEFWEHIKSLGIKVTTA